MKKAFVLAAGFGTRMLPLTRVIPKPLLPVWNVPAIDRILDMLERWGVEDALINVHHGADAIVRHLVRRAAASPRMRIQLSFEPAILGTGGALVKASWFFTGRAPFWMINADIAADLEPGLILKAFKPGRTIAACWVDPARGPRTVRVERGSITDFADSRPGTEGTATFCGLHLIDPHILRFLPRDERFASIITAYRNAIKQDWAVAGVSVPGSYWADIGMPSQYLDVHRETGPSSARPFRAVAPGARIERGAMVGDAVVLDGAVIRRGASVRGMIVGPGVTVNACSGVMAMRAEDALDEAERGAVSAWAGKLEHVVACPLAPRGSSRTFTRLYAGRRTSILVRHDPARDENNLYADHARFLAALGVPVPQVLAADERHHITLFSDAGEVSVEDAAPDWSGARLERLYRDVLEKLTVFHEEGARCARKQKLKLMPPFSDRLYAYERDLFTDLFLAGRVGLEPTAIDACRRELVSIADRLLRLPRVLVHRDLQSSNIMLKGRRWSFIDFQGMRFGAAVYDLASLLFDPYITIDDGVRGRLLCYYAGIAGAGGVDDETAACAAVQRLAQAAGAFARFGKNPATVRFTGYIYPALCNMSGALKRLGRYPALEDAVRRGLDSHRA